MRELRKLYNQEVIQTLPRLPRDFFARDGLVVAKELLGKILVHETSIGTIRGIITEVESYMGVNDKGSHTYGGRRTERTEPMFHKGGTSYVYFTYGMYHCMNITTGWEDVPQAVLIRGVIPADEASEQRMLKLRMDAVRKQTEKKLLRECRENLAEQECGAVAVAEGEACSQGKAIQDIEEIVNRREKAIRKNLADGPSKLCIAMEVSKADNDVDMVESPAFYVTEGIKIKPEDIKAGKRIGIDYAEEAADYLWRFYF